MHASRARLTQVPTGATSDVSVEDYYEEIVILGGEDVRAAAASASVEDAYEELVILRAVERAEEPGEADVEGYYHSYEIHYARPGEAEAFTDLEHSFFAAGEALEREAQAASGRPAGRRRAAG